VDDTPLDRAARGESVEEEEIAIRRTHGDGIRVAVSARPLVDEGNVVQGGVMVIRDVTAQRRSEATLRETEVEMRFASEVQRGLYPREAPDWPGLDVAGDVLARAAEPGQRSGDGSDALGQREAASAPENRVYRGETPRLSGWIWTTRAALVRGRFSWVCSFPLDKP